MTQTATKNRLARRDSHRALGKNERLAQSVESATKNVTPESAVEFLSKLSMYDEKGQLKR